MCSNIMYVQSVQYTVNPALLASSFVRIMQLCLVHISLFKVIIRKYFSHGKCEIMNFLFVLLDKIKIFILKTVYFPHQLLHLLFLTLFGNRWAIYGLQLGSDISALTNLSYANFKYLKLTF
jgi:hypothetical protein